MASTTDRVRIHYRRPPDREDVFDQRLVYRTESCIVTLLDAARLTRPMRIDGEVVLEDGSPIVWFTFPGVWHDIGRFHRADDTFTGLYANILTPVRMLDAGAWETTDLFLDVWLGRNGSVQLLDADELEHAAASGWIAGDTAAAARSEAERLVEAAGRGAWPPPIVHEWTLDRARARSVRDGTPRRGPV